MLAASDVRGALRRAARSLRPPTGPGFAEAVDLPPTTARHLTRAAVSLTAGRDLLHTHFSVPARGDVRGRSEWSDVVTSTDVTAALLEELTRWARRLPPLAAALSLARGDL